MDRANEGDLGGKTARAWIGRILCRHRLSVAASFVRSGRMEWDAVSLVPASAQTAGVFGEEGRGMEAISLSQTTNRSLVYARAGTRYCTLKVVRTWVIDGGRGPPKSFLVWRRKTAAFVLVGLSWLWFWLGRLARWLWLAGSDPLQSFALYPELPHPL